MTGAGTVDRAPGLSVRLKLTLSYAGFLMLAGVLLLAVVWVFLLRYVPDRRRSSRPLGPVGSSRTAPTSCAPSRPGGARAGLPAGVRPRGRVAPRRPDARPADPHHRRHTHGRERIALPPDPAGGPQRRVPRARRRLRRDARAARGPRRRAAAVRRQRLPRAAHPAGDHADAARRRPQRPDRDPASSSNASTPSTPGRSTSPRRCSCSAAPTSGPSPGSRSTCPSSPRKPPRRCSRSPKSAASPSRPPATRPRPSAHTRSAADDDEPRAQRHRPQPPRARHGVGHDRRLHHEPWC